MNADQLRHIISSLVALTGKCDCNLFLRDFFPPSFSLPYFVACFSGGVSIPAVLIARAHCVVCSSLFIIRLRSLLIQSGAGSRRAQGMSFIPQAAFRRSELTIKPLFSETPAPSSPQPPLHRCTHKCTRTPALNLLPESSFPCTIMTCVHKHNVANEHCAEGTKKDNHPWLSAALLHIFSLRGTCFITRPVALSLDLTGSRL